MISFARLIRMRTWLWAGVVGAALVPALLGYGLDGGQSSIAGHIGMLRIGVTNWAGIPAAAVMKYSTASPRRPDATSWSSCST